MTADTLTAFAEQISSRVPALLASAQDGPIARAADLLADAVAAGGVIRCFGTGHSEAFAMEVAGRAGGLIPTSRMSLKDLVVYGSRKAADLTPEFERDPSFASELFGLYPHDPTDIYIIASNSGVNGSIVGVAHEVKERGNLLIAVTSLDHTMKVEPKHPSGKRLADLADVVIDNLAPYGDSTLSLGGGVTMGAISSITAAYIAQFLTLGTTERLIARGIEPPVFISANVPGGDEHNNALKERYKGRLRLDG